MEKRCLNCETPLTGPFCHQCGQEDKHYIRNVWSLVTELFGEMGNWDGRVWRTLIPLFVRPSFLSRQYVEGKRVAYVPPLRLYIFISLIAFLFFSSFGSGIQFATHEEAAEAAQIRQEVFEQLRSEGIDPPDSIFYDADQRLQIDFLSDENNALLRERLLFLQQHPKIFVERFFSLAPQLMLFMLPLFALFLKLLYAFSKRYYVEHLVLALHTNAFILLNLMVILGLYSLLNFSLPVWLAKPIFVVQILLWIWIPVYLLFSQKKFYRQSWGWTLTKFFITTQVYLVLAAIMFTASIILSVVRS